MKNRIYSWWIGEVIQFMHISQFKYESLRFIHCVTFCIYVIYEPYLRFAL